MKKVNWAKESFAVFILSHGRPHNVKTYDTLKRFHYSGAIYILIDNEDPTAGEYYEQFGDQVIMFDKAAIAQTFDEYDNFNLPRKSVVYARNACFPIAQDLGLKYFLELDDDYRHFEYRHSPDLNLAYRMVQHLDPLFKAMLDFYKSTSALTISFAQTGDIIGGNRSHSLKKLFLKRKAMNSFFCSVDRPFTFTGRINEDVNTYCALGHRGELIFQVYNAFVQQTSTQQSAGGMSDLYQNTGTYLKTFYTVMANPSFVKVSAMPSEITRFHHRITWPHAVPVIINEKWRKIS